MLMFLLLCSNSNYLDDQFASDTDNGANEFIEQYLKTMSNQPFLEIEANKTLFNDSTFV